MNNSDSDPLSALFGKPGEPVPEVDPEDVKAAWREFQDAGPNTAITLRVLELVCKPGADIRAVSYRCRQLGLLQLLSQHNDGPADFKAFQETITALISNGSAFHAISKVPMEWVDPSVLSKGLPYDFDHFLKLCAA